LQRLSDTPMTKPWRRLVCWYPWALCLFSGCSFPAHNFTNDSLVPSGGHSAAGSVAQTLAGRGGALGSGGSGTNSSSQGGGIVTEICDNRIDDDDDGRIDCSDPDCSSANWVCLPPLPPGNWKGPIAIARTKAASALPSCDVSGGYSSLVSAGWCSKVSAAQPTCSSCPVCSIASSPRKTVPLDLNMDCSANFCTTGSGASCHLVLDEGCQEVDLAQSSILATASLAQLTIKVGVPIVSGGTCQSALTASSPVTPIDEKCLEPMKVCSGPAAGSCSTGGSCMLKPLDPYDPVPCIYFDGPQTSCPSGWDSLRQIAYANVVDTRDCSGCTCSPPASAAYVGTSAAVVDYATDSTCLNGSGRGTTGVNGCFSLTGAEFASNGVMSRYFKVGAAVSPQYCVQSGGKAVGSVETQSPVTICCASL